jgi:formylmethanofuran dehydrogenase subunit C
MLRLTYTHNTCIPIEAECLTPDQLAGKSALEIARLPVQHGNAQAPLGEFFRVEGDARDGELVLSGDCSRVKLAGAGMTGGRLTIEGNIGMHVGAEMQGGSLEVLGNAADWAGAEMRGGTLRIRGDAGHLVGGCYRGGRSGMKGGTIIVDGNAGNEIGNCLRRGLIAIGGNVGDFTGVSMIAGTILVFGEAGIRLGAGMKRGTIAAFGKAPQLLPTFRYASRLEPLFLRLYFRRLREAGFPVSPQLDTASCRLFCGDLVALGKGEVLVFSN